MYSCLCACVLATSENAPLPETCIFQEAPWHLLRFSSTTRVFRQASTISLAASRTAAELKEPSGVSLLPPTYYYHQLAAHEIRQHVCILYAHMDCTVVYAVLEHHILLMRPNCTDIEDLLILEQLETIILDQLVSVLLSSIRSTAIRT